LYLKRRQVFLSSLRIPRAEKHDDNLKLWSKLIDYKDRKDYNLRVMNSLKIGDKVIYPTQGIGIIEDIKDDSYNGQSFRTFHIRLLGNNTLVVIPSSSAAEIGLRRPISQKAVNRFFQFLKSCPVDISADWKDRYKENFDLMKSGHLEDIGLVYKTLFFLSQTKTLSFREKKMLEKARDLIITELTASSCSSPEKISAKLNQCLASCLKELKLEPEV